MTYKQYVKITYLVLAVWVTSLVFSIIIMGFAQRFYTGWVMFNAIMMCVTFYMHKIRDKWPCNKGF